MRPLARVLLLSAALLPLGALGDVVRLKNGSVCEGRIVEETERHLVMELATGGTLTIQRDQVETVSRRIEPPAKPPPAARPGVKRPARKPAARPRTPSAPKPPGGPEAERDETEEEKDFLARLPDLLEKLESEAVKDRLAAVRTLQGAPHGVAPRILHPLLEALEDPEPAVRAEAARALAGLGAAARTAVPPLLEMLRDEEESVDVKRALIESLGRLGAEAAPAAAFLLEQLRAAEQIADKGRLAEALGRIGPPAKGAAGDILAILQECLKTERGQADGAIFARALGGIGPDAAAAEPLLASLVAHDNAGLRTGALEGLAGLGEKGRASLRKALFRTEGNPEEAAAIRLDAVRAVGTAGAASLPLARDLLKLSIDDEQDLDLREAAVRSLVAIGPSARETLVEALLHLEGTDPLPPELADEIREIIEKR